MSSKTFWNYRVIKRSDNGSDVYQIHEVYYDDNEPTSWTVEPVKPLGMDMDELAGDLKAMTKALSMPILQETEVDGHPVLREISNKELDS